MIELNDFKSYWIKGTSVKMISSKTAYGWYTVAEIDQKYHYLGDQLFNIISAITLWEKLNSIKLTDEEVEAVMIDNSLRSFAI